MPTQDGWCTPGEPDAAEPRYSGTLEGEDLQNALCATGWSPYTLTGFVVDWLRRHFGSPLNVDTPDLRNALWTPSQRTGIVIEEEGYWFGDKVEKRPAVVVKRNAYRSIRLVRNNLAGHNLETGVRDHFVLWSGSHTVFCIHRSSAAADLLATEVQMELTRFAPVLVQMLGLLYLDVVEVGPASEVEEATESRVVPVTLGWVYEEGWQVIEEAPPLRQVTIETVLRNP